MKRMVLGVLAIVCLVSASSLSAQNITFGVAGGLLMPMGDYNTADKPGFIAGAGVRIPIGTAPVAVRLEGTYSQTSHDGVGGKTKIIGGMASLVYAFQAGGSVTPYVLGGLGYYNAKVDVTGFGSASESKFGFGGGGGLRFPMGGASLFVEARYISVQTSGSALAFVPIIAGVSFGGGAK